MSTVSNKQANNKLWTSNYIVILIANALGFLGFNMATAGTPAYLSVLGAENTITGMVTTLAAVAALSVRPLAGYLLSRTSAKTISVVGLLLMSLSTLILLPYNNYLSILIIRLTQGLGWGLASTGCSSIIAQTTPDARLSEGIGFSGAISSITTAVAPIIAIISLEKANGTTMMICIGIILLFSVALTFKLHLEDKAQLINSGTKARIRFFEAKALLPGLIIFFITVCYSPIITFVVPASKANGLSNVTLFYVFYAIATIIVRPITGIFVDRHGYQIPAFISMISAFGSLLLMSAAHTELLLCLTGVFSGLSTGIGMNTLQTMALNRVPTGKKGLAMSTFLFGFDMGMAVGAMLAGIISKTLGYSPMFTAFAILPIVGVAVLFISTLLNRYKNRKEIQ